VAGAPPGQWLSNLVAILGTRIGFAFWTDGRGDDDSEYKREAALVFLRL